MKETSILNKIVINKEKEVKELYKTKGLKYFENKEIKEKPSFFDAIKNNKLNLIAEIKKASPSKGIINHFFDPLSLCSQFEKKGASALSILTDKDFFQGSPSLIPLIKAHTRLPILRKDFIIDPIQIYEASYLGASAILLIQEILSIEKTKQLSDIAESLELDVLLEIHNQKDLEKALENKKIKIIGINNRDLKTFNIEKERSLVMIKELKKRGYNGCTTAESGYENIQELIDISKAGFNSVLIGEGLIKQPELFKAFNN